MNWKMCFHCEYYESRNWFADDSYTLVNVQVNAHPLCYSDDVQTHLILFQFKITTLVLHDDLPSSHKFYIASINQNAENTFQVR